MKESSAAEAVATETRKAFQELLATLREIESRFLSPEWRVERSEDVVAGHRYLMHLLSYATDLLFEADLERAPGSAPVYRMPPMPWRHMPSNRTRRC